MADIYAKIDMSTPGSGTGTVINMQCMSLTDFQDPSFTWVDITGLSCSDSTVIGIGCTYNGTVFTSYVPAPTLLQAQSIAMMNFYSDMQVYVNAAYSDTTKLTLLIMYIMAINNGLTNRAVYIAQALNWSVSILTYAQTVIGEIEASSTVSAVEAITWNIAANIAADPNITLLGALSITN